VVKWHEIIYSVSEYIFTKLNSNYTLKNKAMNLRIRGLFCALREKVGLREGQGCFEGSGSLKNNTNRLD